jgi:predicted phage terminase large subunit-like protein
MTPEEIATLRTDLLSYSQFMFRARRGADLKHNWHQEAICNALERVVLGKTKRLIINVPPRSGKTELAVINFIAWCMGNFPDAEFIHASYSKRLATNNTFNARAVMQNEGHAKIFGAPNLREDSNAKDEFRTAEGGIVYATGAEGTITGFGAGKMRSTFGGCIIIDDPHKAGEGDSDTMRQNVLDWFITTMESRKNSPDTPIIIIMQRLHAQDLSGFLLDGGNGEKWEHLCIPAIQDNGTSFWPEQFPIDDLRRMETANAYRFAGQYQQDPAPRSGGLFKPDAIEVVQALPNQPAIWVRGWDLAATTDGDWTAGVKIGRLNDGRYIIADVVRLRSGPDGRDAAIKNAATRDGMHSRISIPQDPGQAGKTQVLSFARLLEGYTLHTSPESGDKVTRAEPLASQVNVGNVLMLRGEWNDALISEMRMFPNSAFDDQVDAMSRGFSVLLDYVGSRSPQAVKIEGL